MNENKLLNQTLELLDKDGNNAAYLFLQENIGKLKNISSQVYNYLYCLAATSNKKSEAIEWLEEAIINNGFWYRPENFSDDDLESLQGNERFEKCKSLSYKRYQEAVNNSNTVCTWKKRERNKLVLILHGNQQNIQVSSQNWDIFTDDYQVEYIQSKDIDSIELFRWEEDAKEQVTKIIKNIEWIWYDKRLLCGYSSGCNEILKALLSKKIECEYIVLLAPWIPIINDQLDEILNLLKYKNIKVFISCGTQDKDCFSLARKFEKSAAENGIDIKKNWSKGLAHDIPKDFQTILRQYLNENEV